MRQYADQVGVSEIRFLKSGADNRGWKAELVLPGTPSSS
jgi:hypothetical protein